MIETKDYCPNCDYVLIVANDAGYETINDAGSIVVCCPSCFKPLIVIDGILAIDEVKL